MPLFRTTTTMGQEEESTRATVLLSSTIGGVVVSFPEGLRRREGKEGGILGFSPVGAGVLMFLFGGLGSLRCLGIGSFCGFPEEAGEEDEDGGVGEDV